MRFNFFLNILNVLISLTSYCVLKLYGILLSVFGTWFVLGIWER